MPDNGLFHAINVNAEHSAHISLYSYSSFSRETPIQTIQTTNQRTQPQMRSNLATAAPTVIATATATATRWRHFVATVATVATVMAAMKKQRAMQKSSQKSNRQRDEERGSGKRKLKEAAGFYGHSKVATTATRTATSTVTAVNKDA